MTKQEASRTFLAVLKDARIAWGIACVFIVTGWNARDIWGEQAALPERVMAVEAAQDHLSARQDTFQIRLNANDRVQLKTLCLVEELFKDHPDATRCALLP